MSQPQPPALFQLKVRNRDEVHRSATPLDLMFDLAAVIAIAASATGLHHAVAEAHFLEGLIGFFYSFFMIWLSWMNYTWFASTYDDGSNWFKNLTMLTMFGALVLAAGTPAVFSTEPLYVVLVGFIIMRLALLILWLAAARGDSDHAATARFYALAILVMQV